MTNGEIKTIGIVGLGMIGGSMAAALGGAGYRALGLDCDPEVMATATAKGYICDKIEDFSRLDVLIVALREQIAKDCLKKYAPKLRDGATVMDVCGNKRGTTACMKELKREFPALHFVGTHPMAGRETDGRSAGILKASPKLFSGAYAVIVPIEDDAFAVDVAKQLYGAMGVRNVTISDAKTHDSMISYTSQLAHILSSGYAKNEKAKKHRGFSAGSFADLTRVARLDPEMWAELFLNNRDMLVEDIAALEAELGAYREALEAGDSAGLVKMLEEGNEFKDAADGRARADKVEK